jgi:mannitol/fructose-specific phosphotransferase system IIA component (Ntr-type)
MVENIAAKDIIRRGLEDELKQITIERDQIALDRFDHLVKQAVIMDLEANLSAKEMFRNAARELSCRVNIDQEKLYEMFLQREMESSTVIRPGLAIPHIIIEGEHVFDLLIVRCKKGIVFSELHPPVTTSFILIGSMDERNYHLRALMNIAHIVQEADFDERWNKARNMEELRDVILLSKRQREQ